MKFRKKTAIQKVYGVLQVSHSLEIIGAKATEKKNKE